MSDVCVRITEFTDPGCPWALSAEPFRRRLNWLYEGRLKWIARMVVLSDRAEEVLGWAGTPQATQEVAVVCDMPFEDARQDLGRVAKERHVGADGYWTL